MTKSFNSIPPIRMHIIIGESRSTSLARYIRNWVETTSFCLNLWMQFERAVSDFTRVIELDSGNANAYFNRGSACVFTYFNITQCRFYAHLPLFTTPAPLMTPAVTTLWANSTEPLPTTRTHWSSTWQRTPNRVAPKGRGGVGVLLNDPTQHRDDARDT